MKHSQNRRQFLTTTAAVAVAPMAGISAPATARRTSDPERIEAVQKRLDEFAELTGTTPPPFDYDEFGNIELSTPLLEYCVAEGCNLDWLFCGDMRALLGEYRDRRQEENEFQATLQDMSKRHKDGLILAMRMRIDHGVPIKDALAAMDAVL